MKNLRPQDPYIREKNASMVERVAKVIEDVEAEIKAQSVANICARFGMTVEELYHYRTFVKRMAIKNESKKKKASLYVAPQRTNWLGL